MSEMTLQSCGCPRVHEIAYGHTCTVHDETGKRWSAYTVEEVAALHGVEIQLSKEDTCYCGRHPEDGLPDDSSIGGLPAEVGLFSAARLHSFSEDGSHREWRMRR